LHECRLRNEIDAVPILQPARAFVNDESLTAGEAIDPGSVNFTLTSTLRGGHIRVGLEGAPLGTTTDNLALLEEAVRMVRACGAEPASAAEMRGALATLPGPTVPSPAGTR
jgi:hypothetical protein